MLKRTFTHLTLRLLLALLLASLGLPLAVTSPAAAAPLGLVQFQSADGMYVSNGTYALRLKFVDANDGIPQAANSAPAANGASAVGIAPQLAQVTYPNLWPGVSLAYDAGGGIARSTYTLAPRANLADIRLRYNALVTVEAGGSLRLAYDTGEMRLSAPLAWQEMDGVRVAVPVTFQAAQFRFTKTSEVSFRVGHNDPRYPLTIASILTWNTFLGGSGSYYGDDKGYAIAVDGSGNVYVAGSSDAAWGSPVRAFTQGQPGDAFVAKLHSDGSLTWNTFLGGGGSDDGNAIAVDGSGNVYVAGSSAATWGTPVRPFTGPYNNDAFAAKLGGDGSLIWNTFLGGEGSDDGNAIAVDGSGNVYVAGDSNISWGSPVQTKGTIFAAKLSASDGSLTWNTFLGSYQDNNGCAIAVDGSGNVYVAGSSYPGWGSPVRAFTTWLWLTDAFAAKLSSDGSLVWNTFLGGKGFDKGNAIAVDGSGNVYVVGSSDFTWGYPKRGFTQSIHNGDAYEDAFAAKLGSDGSLVWNTFLGGDGIDTGNSIAMDGNGNVHVAGSSSATWGCRGGADCTVRAYTAGQDAFAAQLGSDGILAWDTFLGGSGSDTGNSIAMDGSGNIYLAGSSDATWGSPVRAHTAGSDAFVLKLGQGAPDYASSPLAGSSIDMGQAEVGSLLTATLAISETGSATLNVTGHVLSGPDAVDFSVSPATLSIPDGGAAQQLSIQCTPGGPGLRTATLTINHNAVGSPATYTFNCTGLQILYLPLVTRQ